jgi:hypothetical protein
MKPELRLSHKSELYMSGTDGKGCRVGRARARPGGKRRLMPGWSEAVDEGDKHRGSQRPVQVESHL